MPSPKLRWLLAAAALVGSLATVSVARPAGQSNTRRASAAKHREDPAVTGNADGNSAFGQALDRRLNNMSDEQLDNLETFLPRPLPTGPAADRNQPTDDEAMMMADMPPIEDDVARATVQPDEFSPEAERESTESILTEERYVNSSKPNKRLRLKTIKHQILDYMGWGSRDTSPSPTINLTPNASSVPIEHKDVLRRLYEKLAVVPSFPSDTFTEKTQSFYPNCGTPKNANEELWFAKDTMNFMFNISVPKPSNGNTVNITAAMLRLYKQLLPCTSQTSNETAEDGHDCSSASSEETSKRPASVEVPSTTMEDRQIRVSVYAYTRTLRKKKGVRRKLLDCRMVPYYSEKWTEWNIRSAVKNWRQDPPRNFGISVEVEDEDGNILPVTRFFKPMNCTSDLMQMSTPKPIPGFLIEYGYSFAATANASTNVSSLSAADALYSNTYRYPTVDVTTIEVPNSELSKDDLVLAYSMRHALEQTADDRHRIRHNNNNNYRHRSNGTTANTSKPIMNLSDAEREFRDRIIVLQRHVPVPPIRGSNNGGGGGGGGGGFGGDDDEQE